MARLFKALGDETRLRIVALLSHGELCVCHIEAALTLTQPTASRHLGVLRATGVVDWIGWSDHRVSRPILEQRSGEWLPFENALFSGVRVPFISTVFVRDRHDAVVPRTSGDAGGLLKELEVLVIFQKLLKDGVIRWKSKAGGA